MPPNDTEMDQQPQSQAAWPIIAGSYRVGDPQAPVAVCVLTSDELLAPLVLTPGVAIAGEVQTANLGIEQIVLNITANPAIRFLLLCGKDSRLFRQGQSLGALIENGVDEAGRIVGAEGYEPVLRTAPRPQIARFRRQAELVNWVGERDLDALRECISSLVARNPGRLEGVLQEGEMIAGGSSAAVTFTPLQPGGQREPLIYDPKGYFVILLSRAAGQIVLRHYLPDHTPAHEMRGRGAESMLLGLLREGLISQLSHAGYLGGELAKAESALRLGMGVHYEQDRPLRSEAPEDPAPAPTDGDVGAPPSPPAPSHPLAWAQFSTAAVGARLDVTMIVTLLPTEHLLIGTLAEPVEGSFLRVYRRTDHPLRIRWSDATKVVMGTTQEFEQGAILRAAGVLCLPGEVEAEKIVVLTKAVTLEGEETSQ
jgi:tetrahydromethanopterin S-methyltransferase subunit A